MHAKRHNSGFTLLEILIAFAIMAAALAALSGMFGDGIRAQQVREARLTLVRTAENRLAAVGSVLPLTPGTRRGEDGPISWTVEIAAIGAPTPGLQRLYRIEVAVADRTGRDFSLITRRVGR